MQAEVAALAVGARAAARGKLSVARVDEEARAEPARGLSPPARREHDEARLHEDRAEVAQERVGLGRRERELAGRRVLERLLDARPDARGAREFREEHVARGLALAAEAREQSLEAVLALRPDLLGIDHHRRIVVGDELEGDRPLGVASDLVVGVEAGRVGLVELEGEAHEARFARGVERREPLARAAHQVRVARLEALHRVGLAEQARQPRDVRVDVGVAVLDGVAVALELEHAARLGVDEPEQRRLDDGPRLRAELVVDAARARGDRGKQCAQTLRRRTVREPWLPDGAKSPRLLLDERWHHALIGDEVGGQRSQFAPKANVVPSMHAGSERSLFVGGRKQEAQRGGRVDRDCRHIESREMGDGLVDQAEGVGESVAGKRRGSEHGGGGGDGKK